MKKPTSYRQDAKRHKDKRELDELDRAFLKLAEIVFDEWNSAEANEAFDNLWPEHE